MPVFQNYYSVLSGGNETVNLIYNSHFQNGDYLTMLNNNHERDFALGYTQKGIHRDDLELIIDNYPIRSYGSQGQKKSFLIALKLAQYDFLHARTNLAPVLLLDDIFDKLDRKRVENLINLTGQEQFRQIFITDTQKERLNNIVKETGKDFLFFDVCAGNCSKVL